MQLIDTFLGFMLLAAPASPTSPAATTDHGAPAGDVRNSITAGASGPVVLSHWALLEKLARFDRERVPERVVHARGAGAHGVFEAYDDFSTLTGADFLSARGKTTPVFARFSTVIHGKGSPETLRDPRGFAVKFYTEEGNYDLVGNNLPVFFIRDAMSFPDMVHSLKPSVVTNKQDPNRFFEFFASVPEATHMLTFLYSDLGIPKGYRHMDGFGVHAYKWVNDDGQIRYVKYKWSSVQGVASLTAQGAKDQQGRDHQHATVDLYNAIERGEYPRWELSVQMLKPDQLDDFDFDPLDATKVWPESIAAPQAVGQMTLNRNPDNYFQEVEQAAFSPGVMVPGIQPSEDRLLQGRLFSYADTQRYRVGANYQSLPINRPRTAVHNVHQDGRANPNRTRSDRNYTLQPSAQTLRPASSSPSVGELQQARISKTADFDQAGALYRSLQPAARARLVSNFASDLSVVRSDATRATILGFLERADADYARAVRAEVATLRGR